MNNKAYTPEEIHFAFQSFVEKSDALVSEYYKSEFANLETPCLCVVDGRVYWRILKGHNTVNGGSWEAWGFVRKSDGAIFMAASWSKPNTKGKSAIRGYVTDMDNGMDNVSPYGVRYAQ
jgi:hypothetical protein